ncbi:hypothetical protein B5P43_17295 [Bacillus sp. SRB_336]|nr:hypothetical protein B5P43_17295 [Bacillus sp. SRB_336]
MAGVVTLGVPPVRTAGPRGRLLRTVVHLAAVLSAGATLLAIALTLSVPVAHRALEPGPTPAIGLLAAAVGALVAARRPRNPLAWLLLASGTTSAAYALSTSATALGLLSSPGAPWLVWTAWLANFAWVPGTMLGLVLLPQLFPHGALLPGRFWLAWWWGGLGIAVLVTVSLALAPASILFPELANPVLALAGGTLAGTAAGGNPEEVVRALAGPWGVTLTVLFSVLSAGSVANIVVRFRRTPDGQRKQVSLVLAAWLVLIAASSVDSSLTGGWLGAAAAVLYLAALLYSVARYKLYEIDRLVSRGAAGLLLLVFLGAAYVLTAAAVGGWLGSVAGGSLAGSVAGGPWVAGMAATAVVALLLNPARRAAERWVNRAFSRGRPDAARLSVEIQALARAAASPREAMEHATGLLRGRLHMPGLEWTAGQDAGPAEKGPDGPPAIIALRWNGQPVGRVLVRPRRGSGTVSPADVRLVERLEPTLALMAHDLVLTRDLEASRTAVLTAREEERRRIRRDLHDGLGPLLAGTAMTLEAAQSHVAAGPDAAQQLLGEAAADLGQAVADIRTLVDGLRPASLDDLGLVAAIRATLPAPVQPGAGPSLTVHTEGELRNLPAAVEVAALRIVQEALANTARHARAAHAAVVLSRTAGELHVTVADDGTWVPASDLHRGVGLESMRERARELGGRAEIGPAQGQGTRVSARLPLLEEGL